MKDRLLVCNNNTNEIEAYCPVGGSLLYRKPTGVPVLDLLHEPRMAGSEAYLCFIEKAWQGVVVWLPSYANFTLGVAGEPVVLALHNKMLGVGAVDFKGRTTITIFCLRARKPSVVFKMDEAGVPDDMSFHPDGSMIVVSVRNVVAMYNLSGQRVSSFGKNILMPGHVSIGFDRDANVLAMDMTAKRLHVINCTSGSVISSFEQGFVHPTAVAAFKDTIYVLDTGAGKLQTFHQILGK
jgi:hypothetical protein